MPRQYGNYVESSFQNGLVTEASGLNFPEAALSSMSNTIVNDDGSISRRLGFDYESGYSTFTSNRSGSAISEFVWGSAGGDGSITFVVQQIGNLLYFFRESTSGALSANRHSTTVNLNTYKISGAPDVKESECGFAAGKGYLFVTHKYCSPFYVEYDPDADSFTASTINIQIRDFDGVNDGLATDQRPNTLTAAHTYNLYNQGWTGTARTQDTGTYQGKISFFNANIGDYPSNADIWWLYLDAEELFKPHKVSNAGDNGGSPAPKGYYIFSPFDVDRSSKVSGVTEEKSSGYFRPQTCAFFAGRVFYSGVKANGYAGEIYFSQIIEKEDQFGKCYQKQDPTSQHNSDLLADDGGVIRILDAGEIYKLFPSQKAIIVFASNGIWAISGSEAGPFSAEDYMVRKVASMSISTNLNVVDTLGTPLFWTQGGIWTISYEQGEYLLKNLSDEKIKTFLNAVPAGSTPWVKGAFNRVSGVVQWLYSSVAPASIEARYEYDSVLCLNTKLGAYYPYVTNTTTNKLHGVVACADNGSSPVAFHYLTSRGSPASATTTLAEERSTSYTDWATQGATAYDSVVETGYKVAGEGDKEFQSNYVVFHLSDITDSSAFMQGCWDYASSTLSKKWTTAQQIYNSSPTYRDFRMKKLKVRGWGKALNFRIYSESGKPFKINGWSVAISGNSSP